MSMVSAFRAIAEDPCFTPILWGSIQCWPELLPVMEYAGQHCIEPHSIGVKHGSSAMARKAETIDINYVDIAGAHGVTFVENVGALVGERGHDARDNLVVGDRAPPDAAPG